MQVKVNGAAREIAAGRTVAGLLQDLALDAGRVVVELNLSALDRENYERTTLNDGDVLELVEVVGGG